MATGNEIRELEAYFQEELDDAVIKRLRLFIARRCGPGDDDYLAGAAVSEWVDRCRTDGISPDENVLRALCLIAARLIGDGTEGVSS